MKRLRVCISVLLTMLVLLNCLWACAEAAEGALPEKAAIEGAGSEAAPPETATTEGAGSEAVLTLADIEALGAKAHLYDGRITFVDGACTEAPVQSMEDAAKVVDAMRDLLGVDERVTFEPWRTLTDTAGNVYYVFQEMYANTTVSGGAVKVVTNSKGHMLGLVASVADELPDAGEAEGITAQDAEKLVLEHLSDADHAGVGLLEGRTEKVILPVNLEPDLPPKDDKPEERRFVWAVYSENPSTSVQKGAELPFLVHYVTMDGKYVISQPTICPGDETATSGYDAAYVFAFMEPAEYTGTVKLSDGSEQTISVTLMRDTRTDMYYLGNLERRIAVADFYEFMYNNGRVRLEASPDNTGWDNTCLLSLYNYCRAWDYYNEIGWTGGDGQGTPTLILKDFCNFDHEPIDNACYSGRFYGWETFVSSDINDYSQCLDVLAHEFTHCVTNATMTYNDYLNDHGAINEAMSDIQGNLCEMMANATEDTTWAMGEKSAAGPIRSMSDPHRYEQPEHTWDVYYFPNVKKPVDSNDHGGVHFNSSILNNVAWRLCTDGGMSMEDARAFWFAVDCAMVPGTDYPQLSELMPWVLNNLGMANYQETLTAAMEATRIGTKDIPETLDDDRALVTLTLPDEERFTDGHWLLYLISVDPEGIAQRYTDIMAGNGEYAGALDEILAAIYGMEPGKLEKDARDYTVDEILDALFATLAKEYGSGDANTAADANAVPVEKGGTVENVPVTADDSASDAAPEAGGSVIARLAELYKKYLNGLITSGVTAAGEDGRTMRVVLRPGLTLPLLIRREIDSESYTHSVGLAVYTLGEWHDLASIAVPLMEMFMPEADENAANTAQAGGDGTSTPAGDATSTPASDTTSVPANDGTQAPGEDAAPVQTEGGDGNPMLQTLFSILSTAEGRGAVKRAVDELGDMLARVVDPQALVDQMLVRLGRGATFEIPADGLEAVAILKNKDYKILHAMIGVPPTREKAFGGKATVDYGTSELYTREELRAAVKQIEGTFESFDGCEMHTLRYAGDVCNSRDNIQWLNSLDEGGSYVQVVEFLSDFHSPAQGGGAWEPDKEYTDYQWWLARTLDGDWKVLSRGYN